ncbi:SRPBCC family protein [Lentzea sp. JNUCC 0626]|uniref:SRPBCC family protein n=1 Tax=Lentzea sp. JNUCC 0626 TaxID=3367513 RepID=UPI003749BF9A
MRFTKEIVLDRPIERVRVLTSDPAHLHEWQPDLVSITQHSQTPGAAGATATLEYRHGRLEETVLAANADERAFRYESRAQVHTVSYRYAPLPDGRTLLTYTNEMRLSGVLRLFTRRITRVTRERAEQGLDRLKAFVDNA